MTAVTWSPAILWAHVRTSSSANGRKRFRDHGHVELAARNPRELQLVAIHAPGVLLDGAGGADIRRIARADRFAHDVSIDGVDASVDVAAVVVARDPATVRELDCPRSLGTLELFQLRARRA